MERDVERVVHASAIAFDPNVRHDRLRDAEEKQRLIEEVRSDVEPDA